MKNDSESEPILRDVPVDEFVAALQRAEREGRIADVLKVIRTSMRGTTLPPMKVPQDVLFRATKRFRLYALCAGATGTYSPSVTPSLAQVVGNLIVIAFTYATGATAGCSVSLSLVEIQIGGNVITGAPIYRPVTPSADTGSSYAGSAAPGLVAGGLPALVGSTQNLRVTFGAGGSGWCDTCALAAGATNPVITPVTIT